LLLEFAGTKSCSKWVNNNENDWLLGATTGKCEEKDRELVHITSQMIAFPEAKLTTIGFSEIIINSVR